LNPSQRLARDALPAARSNGRRYHLTPDPDGIHLDIRPFRAQVLKADFPNAGQAATIHVPVIAQRLRWGVRAIGAAAGTAVYAAHELIRQVD
jgi:hypothetical protein